MTEPKGKQRFFNVYDSNGTLRSQIDQACKEQDLSRSQLVRHAIRHYLKDQKLG
jgi:hypothetical protein